MREIKFRAWDGTRMYHFENHEWTLDFNDISGWNVVKNLPLEQLKGRKWDAGESSDTAEQFQLMQFTGIKDANGKEIYEGDIVKVYAPYEGDNNSKLIIVEWHNDGGYIIEWDGGFFGGEADLTLFGWAKSEDYQFEVMGNIYQNPELIAVSQEKIQPPKTQAQEP